MRVAVAMSGGVDSSVAALLLKRAGNEVFGISMRLVVCNRVGENSCCTERDRRDAGAVCERLGIEHHTVDLTEEFRRDVIDPFVDSYLRGETPSPCISCNQHLKFAALMGEAKRLDAEKLATGHYARVVSDESGGARLFRGVERSKDQSYFLFPLLSGPIGEVLFPVGHLTKDEVRRIALENDLPVHDKGESQEVCFVPENDYAAFIEEVRSYQLPGPGRFVDDQGNVLGRHRGIHAYTVGQRRGLGLGFGRRKYVLRIDANKNDVILGDDKDLHRKEMRVRNVIRTAGRQLPSRAFVQIRSSHKASPADLLIAGDAVNVVFDRAERAIAPGQAAVFYDGDEVIGGGWIG